MTLKFRTQPPAVEAAFQSGFGRLADKRRALGGAEVASLDARTQWQTALPVFTSDADRIADGSGEQSPRRTAWRYLIVENQSFVETADVADEDRLGGGAVVPRFRGTRTGGMVIPNLEGAMHAAEAVARQPGQVFELRLLDVPALCVAALWLAASSGEDVFIIVTAPPTVATPATPLPASVFWPRLQVLAREVLAAHEQLADPRPDGTPSIA